MTSPQLEEKEKQDVEKLEATLRRERGGNKGNEETASTKNLLHNLVWALEGKECDHDFYPIKTKRWIL